MAHTNSTSPFLELGKRFSNEKVNDIGVLRHCLGLYQLPFEPSNDQNVTNARIIANQLAAHTIIICLDTEHYTLNSDEMTEIGVAVLHTQDLLQISQAENFGDHGENVLKQAKFHFFRIREKTHLPTTNVHSRGAEGNRFGYERFVTFQQARDFLRRLLVHTITNVNDLQGYNCPVVVLGHSVTHDRDHLNGKDLAFDIDALGTVIRYIDTQEIVRNTGNWWNDVGEIGLTSLVTKLGFQHRDCHTACNDVGRTIICAVLLALPKKARTGCARTTQQVANDLETYSRTNFVAMGGTVLYCSRCGSTQHKAIACQANSLRCNECVSRGLVQSSTSHITLHCPVVRDEVAAERLAWYAGQPREWMPKHPFSSRNRLQTFSPNAPRISATTQEEATARRQWYDSQRGFNVQIKPFVWFRRSFQESPQRHAGPIRPSRVQAPRQNIYPFRPIPPTNTFAGGYSTHGLPFSPTFPSGYGNYGNFQIGSRGGYGGTPSAGYSGDLNNAPFGGAGGGRGYPNPNQRGRGGRDRGRFQ